MLPGKNETRPLFGAFLAVWFGWLTFPLPGTFKGCNATVSARAQSHKQIEQERERAYNRQQFTKTFRELQLLGQDLLKNHEAKKLTPARLAKDGKTINKCAKLLRSLTALGDLAIPQKIEKDIATPQEYDDSIRLLSRLIWNFAHNPIHQNSKIFNTDDAARAQTDLLAIIELSKALVSKAKGYITVQS